MPMDDKELKTLSILHYVLSGLTFLFLILNMIYMNFMLDLASRSNIDTSNEPFPAPSNVDAFVQFFHYFLLVFFFMGLVYGAFLLIAGMMLNARSSYNFCFFTAVIGFFYIPFGTILSVFTLIVLNRNSVKEQFR
jgi:hypothetical protein